MRLFIADDEALIRMGLEVMLKSMGHVVVGTASHGGQVYEGVKATQPDLLLLDIRMPDTDGLTIATQIGLEMLLPIVVLTAYTDIGLIRQAADIPVMGYLVKPIHEGKLAPALQLATERFEAVRQQNYQISVDDLMMSLV